MKGPESTTPDGDDRIRPVWRKQFPIDAVADAAQTRREFVGGLAVAGVAIGCGQVALNTISPESDDNENTSVTSYSPLKLDRKFTELNDGEAVLFHFPDDKSPCLLVRISDTFVAYSQKCTHLACPVVPNAEASRLDCPCHRGAFDLQTGEPSSGPPRDALSRVIVELGTDGTLTATGITSSRA